MHSQLDYQNGISLIISCFQHFDVGILQNILLAWYITEELSKKKYYVTKIKFQDS